MDKNQNFETFLLVSNKKISINVYDKRKLKDIFYDEKIINNSHEKLDLNLINFFLNQNIFKIEKLINEFVKNIYLIIESNEFFQINFSIKKIINGNIFKKNDLVHLLNEAKQDCKNTIKDKKIIHMIIENYLIDKKSFSFFPDNLRCNNAAIDIKFICLPMNYLSEIDRIFQKYQIEIKHILNLSYVESYLDKNKNLFEMASMIIDGYNQNEVVITPKKTNIKGFFESFFNYFS